MASKFGFRLANAIKDGEISVNFQGVGLGDSWIDPVDCMQSYPPYLQSISLIDSVQAENLTWYATQAGLLLERVRETSPTRSDCFFYSGTR
jgi:serine carboxypeptidase 1